MNVFHETGPEVTESRVYCGHIRLHFPSVPKAATHNFILASLSLSREIELGICIGPNATVGRFFLAFFVAFLLPYVQCHVHFAGLWCNSNIQTQVYIY